MYLTETIHSNYIEWRIQRPERRNGLGTAIGEQLLDQILTLRKSLSTASTTRALVIGSNPIDTAYGKIWIAGGDLKELSSLPSKSQGRAYAQLYQTICSELEDLPIPVIFAVDGQAIGGGIELALAGDIRIATRGSSFHFKQTRVGLATGYGGAHRLRNLLGQGPALHWLLSAQVIDDQTALRAGLIQDICPESELESYCQELVNEISRSPFAAIEAQKRMLRPPRDRAGELELDLFEDLWMNPDHADFLRKFFQQ